MAGVRLYRGVKGSEGNSLRPFYPPIESDAYLQWTIKGGGLQWRDMASSDIQNHLLQNSGAAQSSSLKTRTLTLMALLVASLVFGLFLLLQGQNQVTSASKQIREILLPAGRLFEQAKTEIDLQVQEIVLLSTSKTSAPLVTDQNIGILKLGPATKTLLNLRLNPQFPKDLRDLFEPWAKSLEAYNQKAISYKTVGESIPDLKEIRQKTQLLHRAIDRATSLELLELSEKSTSSVTWWLVVFAFGVFLFFTFAVPGKFFTELKKRVA